MFLSRFQPAFTDNIVARAEFRHQRYVINTSRSGRIWIALALLLLVPAFLASVLFFVSGVIAPFVSINILPPDVNFSLSYSAFLLLIVMNVALYFVVQLVTVALGANSILREKSGRTWENLLLTNINGGQIVWGKWWATIRALWGDQIMVGVLRFGLMAWAVGRFFPVEPPILSQLFENIGLSPTAYQALSMLLLGVILSAFTVMDAALSAALGIFSALPDWGGAVTGIVVLVMRVVGTIVGGIWIVWMFTTLAQGSLAFILITIGGFVVFGLMIASVLWFAEMVAIRGQASPQNRPTLPNFCRLNGA